MKTLKDRCIALVEELGLGTAADVRAVEPLTGGVASDIARVELPQRTICMKFALPKLKVAADWQVPVHRNAAEYAWLRAASEICPDSAVTLFGQSAHDHGFAMEFIEGREVYLWKAHLLDGVPEQGEAAKVGDIIGRVHAASAAPGFDRTGFDNRADFHAIRIDPYLCETRRVHPGLAPQIAPMEEMLNASTRVVVHGDVSPKNILFRDGAPIILDAECATVGDASFDPAFCLNHLILKAIHLPATRSALLSQVGALWAPYARHVTWEDPDALEARIAALLPVLMLARVDGKSPVEYLSEPARQEVRDISIPLITSPIRTLDALTDRVARHLAGKSS